MKVKAETTVAELQARFPNGFAIGPGTPDRPGELSRVIFASSYLMAMMGKMIEGNQGYMLVDIDDDHE